MNSELDILLEVPGSMPLNIASWIEEERMEEDGREGVAQLENKLNHETERVELSTSTEIAGHATVT